MAELRLRAGTAADVAAMHALDILCFEPPFQFDLSMMRFFASQRDAAVLVAEIDEALVGFVIVELRLRSRAPAAYVVTLDVHPAHRRKGVARRLMQEVDRLVNAAGVQHISLHVYAGNDAAIRFYEDLGYRRVLDALNFYGSGLDGFLYVKAL